MDQIAFAFPFEPVAKGRPRFRTCGKYVQAYTPGKTKKFEKQIGEYYKTAAGGRKFDAATPIVVSIMFGMKVPISLTKKAKADMLEGRRQHIVKPDLDNLVKAVLDGLNGIAWHDDAQIVELHISKKYVQSPHIFLSLHEYV